MTDSTAALHAAAPHPLANSSSKFTNILLAVVILTGAGWAASQLMGDLGVVHTHSVLPYLLLGLALFIALGFEFVNGFHDTANAVATVIYTHSLPANFAVVWSGAWWLGLPASSSHTLIGSVIGAADGLGLPVSTTHVLSSGIAGTMAANGSGLRWSTVKSLTLAWVLTLPVSIILSGSLFWIFRHTF